MNPADFEAWIRQYEFNSQDVGDRIILKLTADEVVAPFVDRDEQWERIHSETQTQRDAFMDAMGKLFREFGVLVHDVTPSGPELLVLAAEPKKLLDSIRDAVLKTVAQRIEVEIPEETAADEDALHYGDGLSTAVGIVRAALSTSTATGADGPGSRPTGRGG